MTLTVDTLEHLAAQASTLAERLRGDVLPAPGPSGDKEWHGAGARRIDRWRSALGASSPARLERRLAWDGLTLEQAHGSIGDVRWPADRGLPPWATFLAETAPAAESEAREGIAVPFAEMLAPIVAAAWRRLDAGAPARSARLAPHVIADMRGDLCRHLSAIAGRTLLAEFDVFRRAHGVIPQWPGTARARSCYLAFVGEAPEDAHTRLLALVERYPTLGRLLATRALLWVESMAELLVRLERDLDALGDTFGFAGAEPRVARLRGALSDSHRGGRSVVVLQFAHGGAVVYKPRAVTVERAYGHFLRWLDADRPGPAHRCLRVLEREDYGWVEFAAADPCADAAALERYHHRAGSLLCIAYVLGAADLHLGNVIASGEWPVLVDLEVIFAASLAWGDRPRDEAHRRDVAALWNSVLRTGLVPHPFRLAGGRTANLAGLAGTGDDVTLLRAEWMHINTDAMSMSRVPARLEATNLPLLAGERADPARFVPQLIAGFEETYDTLRRRRRALLAPNGPLAAFRRTCTRVVMRTTNIYAALLERTLHPRYLADGVERSVELEALGMAALLGSARSGMSAVTAAEGRSLEQLDVPLFVVHADETALRDEAGVLLGPRTDVSGFADVERRVRALSDDDRRRQTALIALAFSAVPTASACIAAGPERVAGGDPMRAARAIAAQLAAWARRSEDGARWTGLVRLPNPRAAGLGDVGATLKDGACGIALFFAALAKVERDAPARALAHAALAPVLRTLASATERHTLARTLGIGGMGGMGGIVYTLTRAAELLDDDPALLLGAARAASTITRDRIVRDRALDVCYGVAGAALGLLAFAERTGDRDALRRARWCGARLLDTVVHGRDGSNGWSSDGAVPLAGYAHGAAGIAHALRRLHLGLSEPRLLAAARGAQRRVCAAIGASQDAAVENALPRAGRLDPYTWCGGITGMGLASAAALGMDDDPSLPETVKIACARIAGAPAGVTDHPCCGNSGRLELLLTAARAGDETAATCAQRLAGGMIERAEERGSFSTGVPPMISPAFFQGIAGIGYQLLRLEHPTRLPSILIWQ